MTIHDNRCSERMTRNGHMATRWHGHTFRIHGDVIKWKHFPRYWPFVRGIYRSPVNSPHKGQWRVALIFSLIFVWINGWVNNREAGDLRRYRVHYDVSVMNWLIMQGNYQLPVSKALEKGSLFIPLWKANYSLYCAGFILSFGAGHEKLRIYSHVLIGKCINSVNLEVTSLRRMTGAFGTHISHRGPISE